MRVVVVGAGIAGLVTAVGLQRAGVEVTVLERAESLDPVGAGISLFGNGLAGLAAVGLSGRVRALGGAARADRAAGLRGPGGRHLAPAPAAAGELQVVHRADLQAVLLAALPASVVRRGTAVARVDRFADRCVALGADGREAASGDLLVGADGAASAIRAALPGAPGLRYAGWTAWRGITDPPVAVRAIGETWGRGELFGITVLGDGRVYWFAGARAPAGVRAGDERAGLARRFAGWHDPIPALIESTPESAVLRHDIHTLDRPLPSFVTGRVVLVGDAAHPMTPNLGQGGNLAIEDAVTLVRLVTGGARDLEGALARYDALRRRRTTLIARRSALLGRVALARNPVAVRLRNLLIRATPASAGDRAARSVQSWRPPE